MQKSLSQESLTEWMQLRQNNMQCYHPFLIKMSMIKQRISQAPERELAKGVELETDDYC